MLPCGVRQASHASYFAPIYHFLLRKKKKMNAPAGNQTRVSSVAGTYTITVLPALTILRVQSFLHSMTIFVFLQVSSRQIAIWAEAMAQWQRVGFQTQRLGVRIPLASHPFLAHFFAIDNQKKNALPKLGIAPRLPRPQRGVLLLDYFGTTAYGGSGYRSRFSTLRRLYATMYNNPPCASIGTRTRILSLEGINTTLVLWTLANINFQSTLT